MWNSGQNRGAVYDADIVSASNQYQPECSAYRFDVFEVQVRSEVLLQNDQRVKIQELPFRMLLVLLENPGRIVSTDELGSRLWGQKTYGELGSSLRTATAKLREALGDDAANPRFVKTFSGQGYKFIANVVLVFDAPAEPPPAVTPDPSPSETKRPNTVRRIMALANAGLLAAGVAILAGILINQRVNLPLAGERDKVVVGGFTNRLGDPYFDQTLSSGLRLKLEESPYLSLVADKNFRRLVKDPDSVALSEQLRACTSLGAQVLVRGEILTRNPGYRVLISAWRCESGRLLTTQKAQADSKEAILPALDNVTEQIRHRLGEPDSSLLRFNVPLAQATTASLSALKAFTVGEEKRAQGLVPASVSDYKLAIDLDPQFALAYARLGTIYFNTGEFALSRQNYQKAFDLRERSTDRERLYITSHYYAYSTGEIQRAIEAYELWRTVYPRDMSPANNLAAEYLLLGQPERAVESARTAVQLDPAATLPVATLALAYLKNGDYQPLSEMCDDPVNTKVDFVSFHQSCFLLDFLRSDEAGMQRQLQWASGNPEESTFLDSAAAIAMFNGKIEQSRRIFALAEQNAVNRHLIEFAANMNLEEALFDAELGLPREARKHARTALHFAPDSALVSALAALVLARVGDNAQAQAEADQATAQSPLDTLLKSSVLSSVQAALALGKHDPAAAIHALKDTRPYDFNDYLPLASAYYRGLAHLANKQPLEAAGEFQRVLDHRSVEPASLYIGLSELELGRALQLAGKIPDARLAYSKAENFWKDADPHFPALIQLQTYERELASATGAAIWGKSSSASHREP